MNRTQVQAYSPAAKGLHWLIVLLVLIQFLTAVSMPEIGPDVVPGTLITLHFSFGLLIVAVMGIRLAHRLLHPVPLEASDAPPWERWTARATHRIFYYILLLGPFLGWASASAHRLPVSAFGIIPLPSIAAPRARWALAAGDIHAYLMWVLLGLVALHAVAALYHHFVRHDGVLRRMLPTRDG
jgi:cytochrome b561